MRKAITFLFILGLFTSVTAQVSLDGELRPRAEFRNGYRQLPAEDASPAAQINQRTRLSLSYTYEDNIRTRVTLQDARLWGQETQRGYEPSFTLYEAWLSIALLDNFSIQAGRQELTYDDQRLMAANNWSLTGRTHDALVAKYNSERGGEVHFGAAFNQSANRLFNTYYNLENYKTLNYLWYNRDLTPTVEMSLLGIADGYEHPDDPETFNLRATWSSFFTIDPGRFQVRVNPAYQHGKTPSGGDISAYYLMVEASTNPADNLSTTIGMELFSGIDWLDTGDSFNAFDDLFGVGHGRNGYMDYFTNFPDHTGFAGLINPYLRNTIQVNAQTSVSADIHLFFLENNFPDPENPDIAVDKYLGTEVDLVLNYQINDFTNILAGYAVMFGSASMAAIKGGSEDEFAHWGFVMIQMTPSFL